MINIVMTKSQYKLFAKVIYNSKFLGTSWFSNEVKKMVYLGDKAKENEIRELHDDLFEMATRYEE
jgi:hypothetical protein